MAISKEKKAVVRDHQTVDDYEARPRLVYKIVKMMKDGFKSQSCKCLMRSIRLPHQASGVIPAECI
jgi:hypothetical protein